RRRRRRLLGRQRSRYLPELDSGRAQRAVPGGAVSGLPGAPRRLRTGALHGLAVGSLGEGLLLVPGPRRSDDARAAAAAAARRPRLARRRAHLLRVGRLHGRRAPVGCPRRQANHGRVVRSFDMERFLLICLAGAAGTGSRYLVALWAAQRFGSAFPYGTMI